jgi:hypothetical protein
MIPGSILRWTGPALLAGVALFIHSVSAQQPFDAAGRPNRSQQGPWNNDVLVYRVASDGTTGHLATFPRAGVPTAARLADGRIVALHQHFPEDDDANFDKVAAHFSSDEGRSWTGAVVIRVNGLPEGMRFPFDPTLVPLPDGRVRLYFTGTIGRRIDLDPPTIHSAISTDAVTYTYEPGVRFGIADRPVIDCAVALHNGVFHLFAPDNGRAGRLPETGNRGVPPGGPPMPGNPARGNGPSLEPGVGYHAVSSDGLTFTREPDVRMPGGRRWLGNVLSDSGALRFFGTGGTGGIWTATSDNGRAWQLSFPVDAQGADPGAVRLRDGAWLIVATGPPRRPGGQAKADSFVPD